MKVVKDCINVTRSFCDLTDVWVNTTDMYIPQVVGFRENAKLVICMGSFFLAPDKPLDPPEFEIVGFTNHISVNVKFQFDSPGILSEELQFYLAFIEEHAGNSVKRHQPQITGNITKNFNYVIDKLIPNTNYCISVYFEPKDPRKNKQISLKMYPLSTQTRIRVIRICYNRRNNYSVFNNCCLHKHCNDTETDWLYMLKK